MSMHRLFLTTALLASLARPQAATAPGAAPSPLSLQDIMSVRSVISPTISPDGQAVLFAQQEWELADGTPARPARHELRTRVWMVPAVGSSAGVSARAVSAPDRSATSPAWSPDGRFISFMSAAGSGAGRPQVWIMPGGGGDARQLTESDGVTSAVWAPDAGRIAFTSRERPTKAEEDRRARGDDATVFEEDLRCTHLWMVDVGTGVTSRVTTGDGLSVKGQATWAPDSMRLAFVAAPTSMQRDHRDAVYVADLARHTIDRISAGEAARRTPAWSPDGRTIAFAGQPSSAAALADGIPPQGVGLFHLMLYDVPGKRLSDASTPSFDRNVGNPVWTPDSRRILFSTEDRVYQNVFAFDLASGQFSRLTTTKNITLGDVNRDGTLASFTAESASSTAEVFVSDLRFASPRQLTNANPQLADRALGQTEVVSWKSGDGLDVEGLLLKPVGYVEGRRYPLLVVVHGGPASSHLVDFRGTWGAGGGESGQFWAGRGWAVLYPNPRGSRSYGEAFVRGAVGDWGGGDYRDIMAGVEAVIERGIAGPERLAIRGWSYGGYMTAWVVSQTGRFKAAMMGAGISNVTSFHGTTAIPGRTAAYFGGVPSAGTRALFLQRSPLTHAERVTTPLLIMHGSSDQTVPAGQSYEFYRALKDRGKIVQLVMFPREGHVLAEYEHLLDMMRREYEWIARHTNPG